MKKYAEMTKEELRAELEQVRTQYEQLKAKGLSLNMARGKPGKEQLDMNGPMMDLLNSESDYFCDGIDVRNYGNLEGLPSCRALFAELLDVKPENVFVGGSASLQLMYDTIAKAYTHGRVMGPCPWGKLDRVKFLCPAPGYDRHFGISESFGMELITVPMTAEGPDMDVVEALARDPEVKGMWCVPKYSNPDGIIYSAETIRRIASLQHAAPDFLLMWDNAYCVHEFEGDYVPFPDILKECAKYGNEDMVFEFASTSKITFPGSGIAALATSPNNMEDIKRQLRHQTIGHDKVNQLRHVRFFGDIHGMVEHMRKHAVIIRPKFEIVEETLEKNLGELNIGTWTKPLGGYFISFDSMPGCAKAIVARAKKAGVIMTGAGATWPYGKDPNDSNIRIAPTYPTLSELTTAAKLFTLCVRLVSAEKLLDEMKAQA